MTSLQISLLIAQAIGTLIGVIALAPYCFKKRRDTRDLEVEQRHIGEQFNALRDQYVSVVAERDTLAAEVVTLKGKVRTLTRNLANVTRDRDQWIVKHDEVVNERDDWNQKCDVAIAERDEWKRKHDEAAAGLVEWRTKHDAVVIERDDWKQKHDTAIAERDEWKRKHDEAAAGLEEWRTKHDAVVIERDDWKQKHEVAIAERDEWKRKHDEAAAGLEEWRTKHDAVVVERDDWKQKHEVAIAERDEWKRKYDEAAAGLEEWQTKHDAIVSDRNDWKSKYQDVRPKHRRTSAQLRRVIGFRDSWKARAKSLMKQLKQPGVGASPTNGPEVKIAKLETLTQKLLADKERLTIARDNWRAKYRQAVDIASTPSEISEQLTKALEEQKEQIATLDRKLKNRDRTLRGLRSEKKNLHDQLECCRGKVSELLPPSPLVPIPIANRVVTVGVDFGTHSVKVVVRGRGEDKRWVIRFDAPMTGFPGFATPTLVRLYDGKLFFGRDALSMHALSGRLFRSLKVDLCQAGKEHVPAEDSEPAILVTAYLAWLLGHVRERLGPERDPSTVRLHLGAPMAHFDNEDLRKIYLKVANAAYLAVFGDDPVEVRQEVPYASIRERLRGLLRREVPEIEDANRRVDIWPESIAPLTSMSKDPQVRKAGLYMTMDMGAGTTEFSVSRVVDDNGDLRYVCIAADSVDSGANEFHDNDQTNAYFADKHASVEGDLVSRFQTDYKRVWTEGFMKEKPEGHATVNGWKSLDVLLVGGGMRRDALEKWVRSKKNAPPILHQFANEDVRYKVVWHTPVGLYCASTQKPLSESERKEALACLAVADGLSYERKDWLTGICPSAVPPAKE